MNVVLLGLRADYYAQALTVPELVAALRNRQLIVGAMEPEQLLQVVVGPARRHQIDLEPALVEALLRDVRDGPAAAALPRLSHALQATWSRSNGVDLTLKDYLATGGVAVAVQASADEIVGSLDESGRDAIRRLFLRLVNVDPAGTLTRRPVRWPDLPAGLAEAARPALEQLTAARLVTVDEDGVDIGHEALIRERPQLQEWVSGDQTGLRIRQDLRARASAWEDDRDAGHLLRGAPLAIARDWATVENRGSLNRVEQEFLDASIDLADSDARRGRRTAVRLRWLVAVMATLGLVASVLAVLSVRQSREFAQERDIALSRRVAVEASQLRATDPALAAQLALAGYRIWPTMEARSVLLDSSANPAVTRILGTDGLVRLAASGAGLLAATGADGYLRTYLPEPGGGLSVGGKVQVAPSTSVLYAVSVASSGKLAAVGGAGETVSLVDLTDPVRARILPGPLATPGGVYDVAFSRDGRQLAAGGIKGKVLRWDLANPAIPQPLAALEAGPGAVHAVAFSPDGGSLTAAGESGMLRLLGTGPTDTALRGQVQVGPVSTVLLAAAYSPDGRTLAVGGKDKQVHLIDVTRPAQPVMGPEPLGAFASPDGATIAAGSSDNTTRLWDVGSRRRLSTTTSPTPVTAAVFLPADPTRIAVGTSGGALRVWPVPGPQLPEARDSVFIDAFAGEGRILMTAPGSADGGVYLWDLDTRGAATPRGSPITAQGADKSAGSAAISPDGTVVAIGSGTGHVTLWDPARPAQPVATMTEPTALIEYLTFSADATLLAAGDEAHQVHLWDVKDPARPRHLSALPGGNLILAVAMSPDRELLAAASADNTVGLWDIHDPAKPRLAATLTGFSNYAMSVAFSHHGHLLATGSADKSIQLWDVTIPDHPAQVGAKITGPTNYVYALTFDPTDTVLAAASTGGGVWLWDTTNPTVPTHLATLNAVPSGLFAVAYNADGTRLAAGGLGRTVGLWETDPDQVAHRLCTTRGDAITGAEWAQYVGIGYKDPCR